MVNRSLLLGAIQKVQLVLLIIDIALIVSAALCKAFETIIPMVSEAINKFSNIIYSLFSSQLEPVAIELGSINIALDKEPAAPGIPV